MFVYVSFYLAVFFSPFSVRLHAVRRRCWEVDELQYPPHPTMKMYEGGAPSTTESKKRDMYTRSMPTFPFSAVQVFQGRSVVRRLLFQLFQPVGKKTSATDDCDVLGL